MNSIGGQQGMRGPAGSFETRPAGSAVRQQRDIIPSGMKKGQISQFTPEQFKLFSQLFGHVGPQSYLSRLAGGDQSQFEEMEAPAWRQFQEAQGQLGSRFSQLASGAMSAQRGSGFSNQANAAASNFAQDLASRRQDLQRQAISDLMGFSGQLLGQRPYDKFVTEKPQSFMQQTGVGFAGGLGQGIGSLLGGLF